MPKHTKLIDRGHKFVRLTQEFFIFTIPGVAMYTWKQMSEAQLFMVASSLAYTTILSIIPVLAVSFAIFQTFGGMSKLYNTLEPMILENLAQGASAEVIATLHSFINNTHVGAVGVGGMIGLIFTSMSMLSSSENAINMVWQTQISRSIFQRISTYWLFITLGPLALSVAVGMATSLHRPLSHFLPSGLGIFLINIAFFFGVYKWVPNARVKSVYAFISAVVTATCWNIARAGYTLYTKKIVTYNAIYGSLGAVPILLLWIYIIWIIVLTGAALTAALQKRVEQTLKAAAPKIKK
jgi:membrane protein